MPRVAYFPDSFHEVNGVAHTSRNFVAYAERHDLPMLCVRAGPRPVPLLRAEPVGTLELARSRTALRLEKDLEFDLLFWRHATAIENALQAFKPDLIHITGPSELGMFGLYFAWKLGIPLAASWHTNVHEYLARRTGRLPGGRVAEPLIERATLAAMMKFYGPARVLFAPHPELCTMLTLATGRPCHLMRRGVDTNLFSPVRRRRMQREGVLQLGYVGRLSVEKNVALLGRIERELVAAGFDDFELVVVGQGGEEAALRAELSRAHFAGVLRGEALATAYADMDLLIFPSHTDTFGNVVLEALASGVPAIVTLDGGPKSIVEHGITGFAAEDVEFAPLILRLAAHREQLAGMGIAAREAALRCSWDAVFRSVYAGYEAGLAESSATQ